MSDYMFMLESHLTAGQLRVVNEVQAAAAEANAPLFLTGGALRDMLGGFPTRDLDFTVEANPLGMAKTVAAKLTARSFEIDEHRKRAEIDFGGGVTAEIAMARQERAGKAGSRPLVSPATIYDDLKRRDFSIDSIALSLNKASRGLLLDPNQGQADLERHELRAVSNYVFFDDPVRLLRLLRLKVRLKYTVSERTEAQYRNAREAAVEKAIAGRALFVELKAIASEPDPGTVLETLAAEKLLGLFSPALEGPKLNSAGFAKLQKAKSAVPFGIDIGLDHLGLFLLLLTETMSPKERAALAATTAMTAEESHSWQKLEARARKVEKELKGARITRPSQLWRMLAEVPGEQILWLLMRSERLVQDRIRNYLQKYLPLAHEIGDREVAVNGLAPGTPAFEKRKHDLIAQRLDARPKKVPEPEAPPPAPAAAPTRGKS